jgi:hypothetical protein
MKRVKGKTSRIKASTGKGTASQSKKTERERNLVIKC